MDKKKVITFGFCICTTFFISTFGCHEANCPAKQDDFPAREFRVQNLTNDNIVASGTSLAAVSGTNIKI